MVPDVLGDNGSGGAGEAQVVDLLRFESHLNRMAIDRYRLGNDAAEPLQRRVVR